MHFGLLRTSYCNNIYLILLYVIVYTVLIAFLFEISCRIIVITLYYYCCETFMKCKKINANKKWIRTLYILHVYIGRYSTIGNMYPFMYKPKSNPRTGVYNIRTISWRIYIHTTESLNKIWLWAADLVGAGIWEIRPIAVDVRTVTVVKSFPLGPNPV